MGIVFLTLRLPYLTKSDFKACFDCRTKLLYRKNGYPMSNAKTIESLYTAFINQLKDRNRIYLLPFDRQEWFRGAYSTIQRTLRDNFSPLNEAKKSECANLLFQKIPRLSGQDFDQKLKSLIRETAKDFKVSIGHSQKLISILTKYAAACHRHSEAKMPKDWKSFAQSEFGRLPVPIDAVVLCQLKARYPQKFSDVEAGTRKDKKDRPTYWAKVGIGKDSQAWSRISDYDTYWSLQERIRELAKDQKVAPLEFEMRHLWVTE